MSSWRKNYVTTVDPEPLGAADDVYHYYDPVHSLPPEGREYWQTLGAGDAAQEGMRAAP